MGAVRGAGDSSADIAVAGSPGAVVDEIGGTGSAASCKGSAADGEVDGCGGQDVGGVASWLKGDSGEEQPSSYRACLVMAILS